MSETYSEQFPLLYEGVSEEEDYLQRRTRSLLVRGRARYKVKGAAAIIRLWPDHWSAPLTYWWVILSMIAFLSFIVYNMLVAFAALPVDQQKGTPLSNRNFNGSAMKNTPFPGQVYMHIFKDINHEVDLNEYLPYIDIYANKYPNFDFHVIIVRNDTVKDKNLISAEENNENALDMLWNNNIWSRNRKRNVYIEYVTLNKYMNESPLFEQWHKLPKQFIQFLARAISIWNKGGIALNPLILTPRSPHTDYIQKIQLIFKKYHAASNILFSEKKTTKKMKKTYKKNVNNIRDIIDALERGESESNPMPQLDPVEAESQIILKNSSQQLLSSARPGINNSRANDYRGQANLYNEHFQQTQVNNSGSYDKFIGYLYKNQPNNFTKDILDDQFTTLLRKRKHIALKEKSLVETVTVQSLDKLEIKVKDTLKPTLFTTKTKYRVKMDKKSETHNSKLDDINKLMLDLKGNILVSETPCHAFLGTVFSNAVHHLHEALTDFIVSELSMFCKGVLSPCKGIDVILL